VLNKYTMIWCPVYDNSLDPWNPELWARESIAILEESMVWGSLVHRDFNDEVARFGDVVNTRKPSEFTAKQYAKGDTVVYQDASAQNVQVKLDQILDISFLLYDVERTYAFADLVDVYLQPAVSAVARSIDRKIAGQAAQFLDNTVGGMGMSSASTIRGYLVAAERQLNDQKVSEIGRNFVMGSAIKEDILNTDLFVKVNEAGDESALRNASLGNFFGLNTFMSLNTPNCVGATQGTATTTSAAAAAGATSIAITVVGTPGMYITIAGDMNPVRLLDATLTPAIQRPLKNAVANGAVVTKYTAAAVDLVGGYAAGWSKPVHIDGGPVPVIGQLVAFGVAADEYIIIDVDNTAGSDYDITLDRPLEAAIADNAAANLGPNGSMNLAFNRKGIALVNRPLDRPRTNNSSVAVVNSNTISMRVATSWDQDTKALKVSIDSLFGVKTLDNQYGCVLLG